MEKCINIVGFGASITAAIEMTDENKRWLNRLGKKLSKHFPGRQLNMVNSGIGGNSAREAMQRFEKDVLAHNPDYVILDLCANNIDPTTPERHVDLSEFKHILEQYRQKMPVKTRTVLFTTPPMYEDLHPYGKNLAFKEFYAKSGGFFKAANPYKDAFREFGKDNNFPMYDFYLELLELGQKNGKETYIFKDGIHMNEAGNEVLSEGIFKIFQKLIS